MDGRMPTHERARHRSGPADGSRRRPTGSVTHWHRRAILPLLALLGTVLAACGAEAPGPGTPVASTPAPPTGTTPAATTTTTATTGKAQQSRAKGADGTDGASAAARERPGTSKAASTGRVDRAFGGGLVELAAGTRLNGAALQPDGKLVVTGLSGGEDDPRVLVARLTPAGTLDASFAKRGLATVALPSGASGAIGEDVAVQRDGKIVVAGKVRGRGGADGMLVARLQRDGSPDRGFGKGGVAALLRGTSRQAEANALGIRANGQIILGGGASQTAALLRVSPSGKAIGTVRLMKIGPATIEGLAAKRNGQIVFAGTRSSGQAVVAFLGRARSDATKDTSFADNGIHQRSYARNGAAGSGFLDVAVQSDGRIVAVGYALDGSGGTRPGAFAITARFGANGGADGSFGSGGVRYTRAARAADVATQPPPGFAGVAIGRNRIYAAGSWDESGSSALQVGTRTRSGRADRAFARSGQAIRPVRNYEEPGFGNDVALGAAGLYVVGTEGRNDTSRGLITRFDVG